MYDDRLLLTYNYKDGSQTLTLKEIEAALSSDLTSMCPPKREAHPLGVLLFLLGIGLEPIYMQQCAHWRGNPFSLKLSEI